MTTPHGPASDPTGRTAESSRAGARARVGGCPVCAHPDRELIDATLGAGATLATVASEYPSVSRWQLGRHRRGHLALEQAKALADCRQQRSDKWRRDHPSQGPSTANSRPCALCAHPERGDFDRELAQEFAGRRPPVSAVARRHGFSLKAVTRHARHHLPADLIEAVLSAHEARVAATLGGSRVRSVSEAPAGPLPRTP